jgi:hypothetical protein
MTISANSALSPIENFDSNPTQKEEQRQEQQQQQQQQQQNPFFHHHHHHQLYYNSERRQRKTVTNSEQQELKKPMIQQQQQQHQRHQLHRHRRKSSIVQNKCIKCAKDYILPIIVTILVSVTWIIGAFVLIPSAYIQSPHMFIINEIIGFVDVSLLFISYFRCVRTSPGYVSKTWEVDKVYSEEDRLNLLRLEVTKTGESRYCSRCGVYQPPRSHHSRIHNSCVLRMDHYCVWVNNVVGAFNHKFFYLFLFYICFGISHYFITLVPYFIQVASDINNTNPLAFVLAIVVSLFLLPLSLMVFMFFGWNTYLLFTNQTAIENHVNGEIWNRLHYRHRKSEEKQSHIQMRHIYNVKIIDNIKSVLGDRILLWLLPTYPTGFDGYHFKTIAMEEVIKLNEYIQDARPDHTIDYSSEEESDEDVDSDENLLNNTNTMV